MATEDPESHAAPGLIDEIADWLISEALGEQRSKDCRRMLHTSRVVVVT